VLGIAAELLESIRLKIGKIRVLAQDGQLAAGKPAGFSLVVLRHAG
jgi:hypothetical protein